MQDRIEKVIELKASPSRVWRALTDHEEFGQWFRVRLDGPFVVGEVSTGQITYPGYEHLKWKAVVRAMEPETRFAYTWCPLEDPDSPDATEDEAYETLVEFKLEAIPEGTRLTLSESGFSALPDGDRSREAMRRNEHGWTEQVKNIIAHVDS